MCCGWVLVLSGLSWSTRKVPFNVRICLLKELDMAGVFCWLLLVNRVLVREMCVLHDTLHVFISLSSSISLFS